MLSAYNTGTHYKVLPVTTTTTTNPFVNNPTLKQMKPIQSDVDVVKKRAELARETSKRLKSMLSQLSHGGSAVRNNIMGLPPIGNVAAIDDSVNISYTMMEKSFHILELQPVMLIASGSREANALQKQIIGDTVKFAIETAGDMSYNHSNTYQQSELERTFANMIQFQTLGDFRRLITALSHGYGGPFMNLTNQFNTFLGRIQQALGKSVVDILGKPENAGLAQLVNISTNLGMDVFKTMIMGGQIDLPNIWAGSRTGMSWTFTIHLRTMANPPKPSNSAYFNDMINPLLILFTLALPYGDSAYAYIEPPYITAKVGNWIDIKLGGITNLVISAPLNRFTLDKMPLELNVQITVTDLYEILLQRGSAVRDMPTLDRFEERLKQPPDQVPGGVENFFKNEFKGAGSTPTSEQYIGSSDVTVKNIRSSRALNATSDVKIQSTPKIATNINATDIGLSLIPGNNPNISLNYDIDGKLAILNLNTDIDGIDVSFDLGQLNNVSDIIAPSDIMDKLINGLAADITNAVVNVNGENFLDSTLKTVQDSIHNLIMTNVNKLINNSTISNITDGILDVSSIPNKLLNNVVCTLVEPLTSNLGSVHDVITDQLEQVEDQVGFLSNVFNFIPHVVDTFKRSLNYLSLYDNIPVESILANMSDSLSKDVKLSTIMNLEPELQTVMNKAVQVLDLRLNHPDTLADIELLKAKTGCTNNKISDDFNFVTSKLLDPVSVISKSNYSLALAGGITNDKRRTTASINITYT